MSSYLISAINPSTEQIQEKIQNKAAQSSVLKVESEDGKAIGIEKAHQVVKFSQKKPLDGGQKLIVIYDAHKMTEEAQNALLKTLEEHAEFVDIVMVSKNENGILETVLSRCKKINIENDKKKSKKNSLSVSDLKAQKVGERLAMAQKISKMEKPEIVELLENWAIDEEQAGFYDAEFLLEFAHEVEKLNLNTRLTLEACFLRIK